jgi:transcriptional regulator with XRE-family HTH domain
MMSSKRSSRSKRISHAKLDRLLTKRGWTQAELAEKSGVTEATISDVFSAKGATKLRKPETIKCLAEALDVDADDICEEIPADQPPPLKRSCHPTLRHWHNCFEDLIARHARALIGPRNGLFTSLADFIQRTPTGGYWVLEGEPGIGKSTFAAALANRVACGEFRSVQHCAVHFNSASQGITTVRHFVGNVAAQLAEIFPLDLGDVSPTFDQDGQFLAQTIGAAASVMGPADALLLVVDAVDEAMPALSGLSNPLYLPTILPDRVYVAITTRPSANLHLNAASLDSYRLAADSEENIQDVEYYLRVSSQREGVRSWYSARGMSQKDFVNLLRDKSAGNFMYLHYVLPAIESGQCQDLESDALPAGLVGYYRQQFARMRASDPTAFEKTREPLICVLASAGEPLGIRDLADLTGLSESTVRRGLSDWTEFLHRASKPGEGYVYSLYHQSFRDFLAAEVDTGLTKHTNAMADRILAKVKPK